MKYLSMISSTMCFLCLNFLCIYANDKQSFKPDLSKNNIKKVHVHRVNCYDYSGGYNLISESNRGVMILEFFSPKDSWAVYKFDLSPILNEDNLIEGISYTQLPETENEYDRMVILGKDTLQFNGAFKDSCYFRKIRLLDTMDYLKNKSDTILVSGYGQIPQVITYNPLFKTHHYIIHDNKIRHWEDSLFRDYYLGFMLPKTENSLYKLIVPEKNILGLVDSISIKEIVVDNLLEYSVSKLSHLYLKQIAGYDELESTFCRYGFILFKDAKGDLWHVSGTSLFRLPSHLKFSPDDEYLSLGNSFILKQYQGENLTYTFFSASHASGKLLPFKGEITLGVQASIRQEMDLMEGTYSNILINDDAQGMHILSTESGNTTQIIKGWKLLKDYGWIRDDNPLLETKYKTHFQRNENYYDKMIFMTPKNKLMIYVDGGTIFELTKKKMKEIGG